MDMTLPIPKIVTVWLRVGALAASALARFTRHVDTSPLTDDEGLR